jgi:uncharacterized protein
VKNPGRQQREPLRIISPDKPDPSAAGKCALAIMTKAPRPGEVKTRLSPPFTPEEASNLNRCFLLDTAAAISKAGESTQGIACYTPVGVEEIYRDLLPQEFWLIAQRAEHLSERLINATEDLFAIGFASVCLINSDSPTIPASSFAEAAAMLSRPPASVVIGPADDGGYYLIGVNRLHRRIFDGMEWSTSVVLEQTRERAAELELPVHLLPAGYDVDDPASLRRLCRELLGPNESGKESGAPATQQFLREIVAREGRERLCPDCETGTFQEH